MDFNHRPTRRRSPAYVREWSSETLHAVAGRLTNIAQQADLSEAQNYLWDCVIAELEYRFRHRSAQWPWCSCELCVPPFPFSEEPF